MAMWLCTCWSVNPAHSLNPQEIMAFKVGGGWGSAYGAHELDPGYGLKGIEGIDKEDNECVAIIVE